MSAKIYASKDWVAENAVLPPAAAAVGQTLVVKAVDENGKPTEWETVQKSAIKLITWEADD